MLRPPLDPPSARPQAIARWLYLVAALIVAMVVVGGITRLTESGLSITEWKPVSGIIPPLNEAQWIAEFAKYQRIPEYQQLNRGMTLSEFKFIFFWEYIHRVLGRVIGLAFALPLAWFAWKRAIPRGYGWRMIVLLFAGGLQGAIGWWMVTSGLAERTDVSHIRLTIHLMLALTILAGLVWTARDIDGLTYSSDAQPSRVTGLSAVTLAILFVQLAYGGLMAGLNAGLAADDWPLMNGRLAPSESFTSLGALINDPAAVHFIHRWWAWVTLAAVIMLARAAKRIGDRRESILMHSAIGIQILLGIATIEMHVELWVAVLHQFVGALVLVTVVRAAHSVGRPVR